MTSAHSIGFGLLAILAAPALAAGQQTAIPGRAEAVESAPFVGFYRIVSGENGGEVIPEDRIEGHAVRITEDAITVLDADRKSIYACTYTLGEEPTAKDAPQRIDMATEVDPDQEEQAVSKAKGIIKAGTNDEGKPFVMLCYATVGDEYPEDFRTRAESEQNLFVLEPIEDEDAAAPKP